MLNIFKIFKRPTKIPGAVHEKTLADKFKEITDSSGQDNLQSEIDWWYNKIFEKMEDRRDNGYYMLSEVYEYNHPNEIRLCAVRDRLRKNGFNAKLKGHGFYHLKLEVHWKNKKE